MTEQEIREFIENKFVIKFLQELQHKEKEYFLDNSSPWGLAEISASVSNTNVLSVLNAYMSRHVGAVNNFVSVTANFSEKNSNEYARSFDIAERRIIDLIGNMFIMWMYLSKND